MLETAENLLREYSISREEQDAFAVESHRRAIAAMMAGRFRDEIVPVTLEARGKEVVITNDEHPRADASSETMRALRPNLGDSDPAVNSDCRQR